MRRELRAEEDLRRIAEERVEEEHAMHREAARELRAEADSERAARGEAEAALHRQLDEAERMRASAQRRGKELKDVEGKLEEERARVVAEEAARVAKEAALADANAGLRDLQSSLLHDPCLHIAPPAFPNTQSGGGVVECRPPTPTLCRLRCP